MSLDEILAGHQIEATRQKDRFRLKVIRIIRAELKNALIARRVPLSEDEELAVLTREMKQRQEALKDYERAGRADLVEEMEREMEILRRYLPEPLSQEEIARLVREAIAETGATGKRDLGRVLGWLMPRVKGKADGTAVRILVEENLK